MIGALERVMKGRSVSRGINNRHEKYPPNSIVLCIRCRCGVHSAQQSQIPTVEMNYRFVHFICRDKMEKVLKVRMRDMV